MLSLPILQDWLDKTQTRDGRRTLASARVPARLCAALPAYTQALSATCTDGLVEGELPLFLRTLRNACAESPESQDQLSECAYAASLEPLLLALCERLAEAESAQSATLLCLALQGAGNACVGHRSNADAAWCVAAPPAPTLNCATARSTFFPTTLARAAAAGGGAT